MLFREGPIGVIFSKVDTDDNVVVNIPFSFVPIKIVSPIIVAQVKLRLFSGI